MSETAECVSYGFTAVATILAQSSQALLQLLCGAFLSLYLWLSAGILLDNMLHHSQISLKGLDGNQHRRVAVTDQHRKRLVPRLAEVVGSITICQRLLVHVPYFRLFVANTPI